MLGISAPSPLFIPSIYPLYLSSASVSGPSNAGGRVRSGCLARRKTRHCIAAMRWYYQDRRRVLRRRDRCCCSGYALPPQQQRECYPCRWLQLIQPRKLFIAWGQAKCTGKVTHANRVPMRMRENAESARPRCREQGKVPLLWAIHPSTEPKTFQSLPRRKGSA